MHLLARPCLRIKYFEYQNIRQRKSIGIKWLDDKGGYHSARVLPIDILVRDKEAFQIAETPDNKKLCICMDKITLLDS